MLEASPSRAAEREEGALALPRLVVLTLSKYLVECSTLLILE